VLGCARNGLFPAWSLAEGHALQEAGIQPGLQDQSLTASRWAVRPGIDWILLIPSLAARPPRWMISQVGPDVLVLCTLRWSPDRAQDAVSAFPPHRAQL
jgi:hypothetical protein